MRKHILLKNEIEMIQIVLKEEGYPTKECRENLANRLEDLKKLWYKVPECKKEKGEKK